MNKVGPDGYSLIGGMTAQSADMIWRILGLIKVGLGGLGFLGGMSAAKYWSSAEDPKVE